MIARLNPNGGLEQSQIEPDSVWSEVERQNNKQWFAHQFVRFGLIRLDGRSRFNLTNDQQSGDLKGPAQNVLAKLFVDDDVRDEARRLVYEAFSLNLVIDPTSLSSLKIGLSNEAVLDDEQSLNKSAREFHARATYIKEASDGVQAYVGIVVAVVAGEYHTILVDEPEAFLHPPLARKLGRQLAQIATKRNGSLIASTHSADFLMGCVQGSTAVRVVRLEYQNGKSKGRLVDPRKLQALFQNPLMRSSNATSALFYDGVIVTESDNDRAFYSEIYHRLIEADPSLPSVLFVNAQNKQTMTEIMGPLRQFGVPSAAIADIDIVKEGGAVWTKWLVAAQLPTALHESYHSQRLAIKAKFDAQGKDMKRDGGVQLLDPPDLEAANEFMDGLNSYGLFPVRNGELESWLKSLGVTGQKTQWAIGMLHALGSDPQSASYVRPGAGDVWDFLRGVLNWISNPSRKGTA